MKGVEEDEQDRQTVSARVQGRNGRLVQSSNEKYPISKLVRDLTFSTETLRKK
jgi:hypothetical protein